jgi:hypothetical protein
MSGNLAIAAVSAVMKFLLQNPAAGDSIAAVVPDLEITVIPPHQVDDDIPRLNIFFYRALPNTGWAQNNLPSRNSQGARVSNPYLAVDLYYLISAHSSRDYHGEILLGYAMQTFHENPVLPRDTIRDALTSASLVTADTPANLLAAIAATELAEQFEQIKLAPYFPSPEEAANVWSPLSAGYVPTMYYRASVVLIESRRPARDALPVRGYNVYGLPFQQIRIDDVIAEAGAGQPILTGERVLLRGSGLRGDDTRVTVGGIEVSGAALDVASSRIGLNLPAGLQAGIVGVQVAHMLGIGTPPQPHQGFESNVVAFVLQPQIRRTGLNYEIQIIPPSGSDPRGLRITLDPAVGQTQRAILLLNELNAPSSRAAVSFTFNAQTREPGSPPVNQLTFFIPDVPSASYLVRVRIAGAESPLVYQDPDGYVNPSVAL